MAVQEYEMKANEEADFVPITTREETSFDDYSLGELYHYICLLKVRWGFRFVLSLLTPSIRMLWMMFSDVFLL
jgi:hypothetical protein